jgi:hypothetical protein
MRPLPPYKQAHRLGVADAAYLAGLIDGEGSVGLTRRHARDNRQLVLSIANTDEAILIWVLNKTGVGKITDKRIARAHHTPSYTYTVANRQALAILAQCARYMISCKRQRADLALAEYVSVTPRNGRYSRELIAARESFEARFLAIGSRARIAHPTAQ